MLRLRDPFPVLIAGSTAAHLALLTAGAVSSMPQSLVVPGVVSVELVTTRVDRSDIQQPLMSSSVSVPEWPKPVAAPTYPATMDFPEMEALSMPVLSSTPLPTDASVPEAVVQSGALVELTSVPGWNRPPIYPLVARRNGWEGIVRVLAEVALDGIVSRVAVSQSSGYSVLDEAAADAVSHWRFRPPGGRHVLSWSVEVPVQFRLRDRIRNKKRDSPR